MPSKERAVKISICGHALKGEGGENQ